MNTINPIPSSLEAQGKDKSIADVKAYFLGQRCEDMINVTRASLIRADNAYRAQRASIVHRYNDELDQLDRKHDTVIHEHQALLAKLEELRR
jgi:hypothetical protein